MWQYHNPNILKLSGQTCTAPHAVSACTLVAGFSPGHSHLLLCQLYPGLVAFLEAAPVYPEMQWKCVKACGETHCYLLLIALCCHFCVCIAVETLCDGVQNIGPIEDFSPLDLLHTYLYVIEGFPEIREKYMVSRYQVRPPFISASAFPLSRYRPGIKGLDQDPLPDSSTGSFALGLWSLYHCFTVKACLFLCRLLEYSKYSQIRNLCDSL